MSAHDHKEVEPGVTRGDLKRELKREEAFYCPEHGYKPAQNSGFAFCPQCEIADTEKAVAAWNTGEPPKDGTTIVICGGLIWTCGSTTTITPVCAPAYWDAVSNEWCDRFSGMTLRSSSSEELAIHWWLPYPEARR